MDWKAGAVSAVGIIPMTMPCVSFCLYFRFVGDSYNVFKRGSTCGSPRLPFHDLPGVDLAADETKIFRRSEARML